MTESATTDLLYLRHILQCAANVREDCAGGRTAFYASRTIRDAVLRNLQVMAESTQRLSSRAKDARADIPWDNIAGFRNRLTHDYFRIDHDLIWRVIEDHLPALELAATDLVARIETIWNVADSQHP